MRILSLLFPPRMPGKVRDWDERGYLQGYGEAPVVHSSASPAKPKPYRNGIDRYFAQEREGARWMAEQEDALRAAGYVNTIHDCWELPENVKLDDYMAAFPAVAELLKTRS